MVGLVQFKKCEKHLWRSVTFSKVAGFSSPLWVPFTFFKLYKMYKICETQHIYARHLAIKTFEKREKIKTSCPENFQLYYLSLKDCISISSR